MTRPTYDIYIVSLLPSNEASTIEESRINRLINILSQSKHGRILLQHAEDTDLVILCDPNEELAHCYPKEHDLGQKLGGVPVLSINPHAFEHAYQLKGIEPTQEQVDDILLSFIGHELRHNVQQTIAGPQYSSNRDAITVLRQSLTAEADAYAWQNLIEIELQNFRPAIKENNSIISPKQQAFYDAVLSTCDPNNARDILKRTFEGWYIAQDIYLNDYTSLAASLLKDHRQQFTAHQPLENIPLKDLIGQYCQMPDTSSYVSAHSIQILEREALYNLPEQTIDVFMESNQILTSQGTSDRSVFEIAARHKGNTHDYVCDYLGTREEVANLAIDLILQAERDGINLTAGLVSSPTNPNEHKLVVSFPSETHQAMFAVLAATSGRGP